MNTVFDVGRYGANRLRSNSPLANNDQSEARCMILAIAQWGIVLGIAAGGIWLVWKFKGNRRSDLLDHSNDD